MRSPCFRSAFGSFTGWRAVALASLLIAALGMSARAQSQEPKPKIAPSAATAAATPPAKTGVHGNAYTSPTFGYTLSWDPKVWTVKAERLIEGYDGLELGTDRSNVFLEGMNDYNGDAAACLADARKQIASRQGVGPMSDFQGPGRPIQDTNGARSLLVGYVVKFADGSSHTIVEYVQCRTLVPGAAVLELTWQTLDAGYAQQLPLVAALFQTLHIPGVAATPAAGTPAATPEASPPALPGATPIHL